MLDVYGVCLESSQEADLEAIRRAREHLAAIKERIAAGTFQFAEEFPAYRHIRTVMNAPSQRTCGHVFDVPGLRGLD